jgi:GntR family transcriptional regulator
MQFQINPSSSTPIYRQLGDQVREAVARGKLRAGERLPSVRELSRELVVNPNTIARVYTELERDGVLNNRQGLGVFVAAPATELSAKVRRQRLTELIDRVLTEAVYLGFSGEEVTEVLAQRVGRFQWAAGDGAEKAKK